MSLPSTKKIRLITPQPSSSCKDERDKSFNTESNYDQVFEWDDEKLDTLVYGYTRNNIKFGIPDISSIILIYIKHLFVNYHINNKKYSNIKYMNNNTIICNFRITNNFDDNICIFSYDKHRFSAMIFAPYISKIFNNNSIQTYKMKINLVKCECNYFSNKYNFQCGIIMIPRTNNNSYKFKQLKNNFENELTESN